MLTRRAPCLSQTRESTDIERPGSQREVIKCLRVEHLVCRIIKSCDEDEIIVLVRAPTYEEFALQNVRKAKQKKAKTKTTDFQARTESTLPLPSFDIMDWMAFWADKLSIEYQVRKDLTLL